mgnify:FL=1
MSDVPVDSLKEDLNYPGAFIYVTAGSVNRLWPNNTHNVLAGSSGNRGLRNGPAHQALFSVLTDFIQYKKTKLALVDFRNHCIRELDTESGMVSTLIGSCHVHNTPHGLITLRTDGEQTNATSNFLNHPVQVLYLETKDYFLTYDFLNTLIYKVDLKTNTVRLLSSRLHSVSIPNVNYIAKNQEETKLYISHNFGLSVIDLETLESKMLVGTKDFLLEEIAMPLQAGPFEDAQIGSIVALNWLIQDQVLVGVVFKGGESLVVIDLANERVNFLCKGNVCCNVIWNQNVSLLFFISTSALLTGSLENNVTIPGGVEECEINTPISLSISNNRLLIPAPSEGNPKDYKLDTPSILLKMPFNGRLHAGYTYSVYLFMQRW